MTVERYRTDPALSPADRIAVSIGRSFVAQKLHARVVATTNRTLLGRLRVSVDDASKLRAVEQWERELSRSGDAVNDESITDELLRMSQCSPRWS